MLYPGFTFRDFMEIGWVKNLLIEHHIFDIF